MLAFLTGRKSRLFVFFFPLAIYLLICTGKIVPEHPVTGDEPHYLIVTHSILFDGDIELTNNYFEQKDYKNYHPGELMSGHYHKGKDRGRYPSHGLGLPVLLIPAYWVGIHFGAYWILFLCRATMAIILSFLVAQIYFLAREKMGDRPGLLAGWLVVSFTAPLVYYSCLVYPEICAALCMIYPFRILSGGGKPGKHRSILAAVMLALLPWLGIKYIPAQIVLLFFWLIVFKQNRFRWRGQLLLFPLLSALSLVFFLVFMQTVFGTVSPAALYLGGASPGASQAEKFLDHLFHGMDNHLTYLVPTLISYFMDQKVGLLFYSPVFILSLVGFFYFFRKDRLAAIMLSLILAAHLLVYAYSTWVGGHSPPPRPLVSVTWIFGFFLIVFFMEEKHRGYVLAKRFLVILSFGLSLIFLTRPGLLYHVILGINPAEKSKFLSQLESPALPFTKLFPSIANIDWSKAEWIPIAVWGMMLMAFLLISLHHVWRRHDVAQGQGSEALFWSRKECLVYVLFIVCGFLFWKWAGLVPVDQEIYYKGPMEHHAYIPDTSTCWIAEQGFWVKADATTKIYLLTSYRINRLLLVMRGLSGNRLRFAIGDQAYDHDIGVSNKVKVTIEQPEGQKWKGRFIYSLSFTSIGGWVPREISGDSDIRNLGFFVKMFPS